MQITHFFASSLTDRFACSHWAILHRNHGLKDGYWLTFGNFLNDFYPAFAAVARRV
jgi:hypothetical protein